MDSNLMQSTRAPVANGRVWQRPQLRQFGSVQNLTAGGSHFSPEADPSAPKPGDPAYKFYKQ